MCIHMIGGWGDESAYGAPTRKSFRSCLRAGEAKLCGRARGVSIVKLGLLRDSFGPAFASGPVSVPVVQLFGFERKVL